MKISESENLSAQQPEQQEKPSQPGTLSVDERYSEIVKSIHRWFGEEDEEE